MKKSLFIKVPAKANTPAANLYVQITHQDEKSLQTKPYVFMLPGGPGANHSHYMDYDCLQDVANIVYYDPRGCGLSDKSQTSDYTMNNYIHDVFYVIHEGLKLKQVILLGKSYGAMCALGYTLHYPEHVSKLILAAGSPSFHNLKTGISHVLARGTNEQKELCKKLWQGAFQNNEEVDDYFKIMEPFYSWKKRNNQLVNRPTPVFPFAFEPLNEAFRAQFWKFNFVNQLPDISCATLILVGDEDWITDPIYSKQMAKKIPNSILKIFPKADHSLESDVPEQFFSTMRAFIHKI